MAIATTAPQTSYDGWRARRWRLTSLAFAAAWLLTAVAVVLVGERHSDLDQLTASIREGSVTQVEVVGLPIEPDWRGRIQVTLKWQGTVLSRFAEVLVDMRRNPGGSWEGDLIIGDPADYLQAIAHPGELEITSSDSGSFQELQGWRAPEPAIMTALVLWFGTLLLAGAGPQPWRATQWAWIWLILLGGPLGSVAFLLLGGPLGVGRPRDVNRRLTGGWAFLIGMVLLGGISAD